MAAPSASSNKAKIARRVIEVLDYFDENHREATVMDIVRRYDRPQSSPSELLCSMVELGLLYKDPFTRSYSLSPRAALLGQAGQPDLIRDGRLVRLLDRLVAQTGLSVALFGMVGLNAQIVSWRPGPRSSSSVKRNLYSGLQEPLSDSAAGWLLLSTVAQPRCDGLIRRLNAEASEDRKFSFSDMTARIQSCREERNVRGLVGYGTPAEVLARLLPGQLDDRPLAAGFVYGSEEKVNVDGLMQCLNEAMRQCLEDAGASAAEVERLPNAA